MLDDAIERSKEIYGPIGGRWLEQKKTWFFPRGGRLRFRPLERVSDAEKYQGQNLTDACVEEAGNYPDSSPIDRLNGVLRSARGVPTQLILTGNPGGPGQLWIKNRYIDLAPMGLQILKRLLPNGAEHRYVFIPSKLQNNRYLMSDPNYVNRLYLVGSPELVRAWLEGDWSAIAGAFFPEFSLDKHVIAPFEIPEHWLRFRAGDWGSARPFSIGWYAVADGQAVRVRDGERVFPRGALIKYREWYGVQVDDKGEFTPNVGLKLTADQLGEGIKERSFQEQYSFSVMDPAAFAEDGGPSIAERMAIAGARFERADNKRVAQRGALGGWDQLRARLTGDGDGKPMLYLFANCRHTIRTIPALQHDQDHLEDVDTDGEDHAADETRYACMARPFVKDKPGDKPPPRWFEQMTAKEVFALDKPVETVPDFV